MKRPPSAVFLDRDGVLIADRDRLLDADAAEILPGVPAALRRLAAAGCTLAVVTNQPVVARGLISEAGLAALHQRLDARLRAQGAPALLWYACPHHPQADVPAYRCDCDCRKPRPGLLRRAAREHGLDLARAVMVGDRPSDIAAGLRVGCRAVLVESGRHRDAPITTPEPPRADERPHHVCADLPAAVDWILACAP